MTTLTAQKSIRVAFPRQITSFLEGRTKRKQASVSRAEEKAGDNDPYFTPQVVARLRSGIAQLERGEGVEHELIEA